ncbi:MAG: hypothetical protein Q4G03_07825 [Planctomycetia bacterium]|nr:hypothetical protein [Planctomycetia bacterium]
MKRIGRRAFLARTLTALVVGATSSFSWSSAGAAVETLNAEYLKRQLVAKTDAECAFIDDVVEKARTGVIPMKFLEMAYRYAMKKSSKHRLFYFKQALSQLCKQAGLKVSFLSF